MNRTIKQLLLWLVVMSVAICIYAYVDRMPGGPKELRVSYAEVLNKAEAGQVKDVTIDHKTMTGHFTTGEQFRTVISASDPEMYNLFRAHGVNISNRDQNSSYWLSMMISVLPFMLLLGLPFLALLLLLLLVRRERARAPKST